MNGAPAAADTRGCVRRWPQADTRSRLLSEPLHNLRDGRFPSLGGSQAGPLRSQATLPVRAVLARSGGDDGNASGASERSSARAADDATQRRDVIRSAPAWLTSYARYREPARYVGVRRHRRMPPRYFAHCLSCSMTGAASAHCSASARFPSIRPGSAERSDSERRTMHHTNPWC